MATLISTIKKTEKSKVRTDYTKNIAEYKQYDTQEEAVRVQANAYAQEDYNKVVEKVLDKMDIKDKVPYMKALYEVKKDSILQIIEKLEARSSFDFV